jgi:hypothetical protein
MRDLVFDRVMVDGLIRGQTRVSWRLFYQFDDPYPLTYSYQLQVSDEPTVDAAWENVGAPVVNGSVAVDPTARARGTVSRIHYRVQLTTTVGVYYSRPEPVDGDLNIRDWYQAQEIIRKELLLFDRYTAVTGWLLKRRKSGPVPPPTTDPRQMLVDPLTGEVIRRNNTVTYGTEFTHGYFQAVPFQVQLEPGAVDPDVDPQQGGNTDAAVLTRSGRLTVIPKVETRDVFVADKTDLRYYIHLRKQAATIRGVPVVYICEFRQADFDDVVYKVPLL